MAGKLAVPLTTYRMVYTEAKFLASLRALRQNPGARFRLLGSKYAPEPERLVPCRRYHDQDHRQGRVGARPALFRQPPDRPGRAGVFF